MNLLLLGVLRPLRRTERAEQHPVTVVRTDGQLLQPQLAERAAEAPSAAPVAGIAWPCRGTCPDRAAAARRGARPVDLVVGQIAGEQPGLERGALVDAVILVDRPHQIELDSPQQDRSRLSRSTSIGTPVVPSGRPPPCTGRAAAPARNRWGGPGSPAASAPAARPDSRRRSGSSRGSGARSAAVHGPPRITSSRSSFFCPPW